MGARRGPGPRDASGRGGHRGLTPAEIRALESRGCSAEDWGRVLVADGFCPEAVTDAHFSGDVRLGRTGRACEGDRPRSGIVNATLHDVTVGDGVTIRNVARRIASYDVADGAVIDGLGLLAVEGESAFGQGARAETVNEAGGREVPLFEGLSSQLAHLVAFARGRKALVERIEALVASRVEGVKARRGRVGEGARVTGAGTLVNVLLGPAAEVDGATRLENVTVASAPSDPAHVGDGVIASDSVVAAGAVVKGGVVLRRSFVGEGVRMGNQFSSENSLFFANSEAFLGESCAAFCGPYTVTHHKSTLLIAGLFSFYNAGSGTNFSNHLYKLGPVHQGVLERGCRTGSDGYLLFPARIGAFSTVIGKNFAHLDTRDLPFSLVVGENDRSVLVPAANLYTSGLVRDGLKWPARDRRKVERPADLVHFDVMSPFTAQELRAGRDALAALERESSSGAAFVKCGGAAIPRWQVQRGREAYALALRLYLEGALVARAEESAGLREPAPGDAPPDAAGPWVDLSGLLAPRAEVMRLVESVESGAVSSLDELDAAFRALHGRYAALERRWAVSTYLAERSLGEADLTPARLAEAARAWLADTGEWAGRVLDDARKEFGPDARIGYDLDELAGPGADFEAVRGAFEANAFVRGVEGELASARARVERLLTALSRR